MARSVTVSRVPSSSRARNRPGSLRATANTPALVAADSSAAARIPTLACSSCSPLKARVATSSDTVNPMPARVPPPPMASHPTAGRSRPPLSRETSQDMTRTPTGLPIT